jgi:hypothetical protein
MEGLIGKDQNSVTLIWKKPSQKEPGVFAAAS